MAVNLNDGIYLLDERDEVDINNKIQQKEKEINNKIDELNTDTIEINNKIQQKEKEINNKIDELNTDTTEINNTMRAIEDEIEMGSIVKSHQHPALTIINNGIEETYNGTEAKIITILNSGGESGGRGIQSISRKGSLITESGKSNTYQIIYTDGTTTNFEVVNGQQGESAYDIWKNTGGEGSQEDFINSLKIGFIEKLNIKNNDPNPIIIEGINYSGIIIFKMAATGLDSAPIFTFTIIINGQTDKNKNFRFTYTNADNTLAFFEMQFTCDGILSSTVTSTTITNGKLTCTERLPGMEISEAYLLRTNGVW